MISQKVSYKFPYQQYLSFSTKVYTLYITKKILRKVLRIAIIFLRNNTII
nr:MAG TPA: hypothetical protein [Caudoviricetes sp.]